MLTSHEKFRILDESDKNHFFAEVNWNPDDEVTNDCKIFKFTFPDGKEAFVQRKYLLEILFACGKPEDQAIIGQNWLLPDSLSRTSTLGQRCQH